MLKELEGAVHQIQEALFSANVKGDMDVIIPEAAMATLKAEWDMQPVFRPPEPPGPVSSRAFCMRGFLGSVCTIRTPEKSRQPDSSLEPGQRWQARCGSGAFARLADLPSIDTPEKMEQVLKTGSLADDHNEHLRLAMQTPGHPIHRDIATEFRRSASALLDRAASALPRESFAELLGHIAEEGQRLSKDVEYRARTLDDLAAKMADSAAVSIRDAALEEAASRIEASDCDWDSDVIASFAGSIRALKSKPATVMASLRPECGVEQNAGPAHDLGLSRAEEEEEILSSGGGFSHVSGKTTQAGEAPATDVCDAKWCSREKRHEGFCKLPPEPQTQPVVHDFGWALARMREGKKVRRASWVNGSFLRFNGYLVSDRESLPEVKTEHLLATDWQVVE